MREVVKRYYIHGYQSSPKGTKGVLFHKTLDAIPIRYRDVPPEDLVIKDCLKCICDVIGNQDDVVLIGSSLGGFLAAVTALNQVNVSRLILLNPAILPPGTDIMKINSMPKRILRDMIYPELFSQKLNADVVIFRGTKDEIVPDEWVLDFARFQEAIVHFIRDDHRFSDKLDLIVQSIAGYIQAV